MWKYLYNAMYKKMQLHFWNTQTHKIQYYSLIYNTNSWS